MSVSTSTRLEVTNRILLNCNERPLTTTSSVLIGTQVVEVIRAAYYKLMRESEWLWTQEKINATSWSGKAAILPSNVQRVKMVSYENEDGINFPLNFQDLYVFDQQLLETYSSTSYGRALYWTAKDVQTIWVNPYPGDATERARIWFYVNQIPTFPTLDSSTFSVPEDFIPILVLMGTGMFVKRHGEDLNLARAFEEEYLAELMQLRARQMLTPNNSFNLYKGRRHSSYERW